MDYKPESWSSRGDEILHLLFEGNMEEAVRLCASMMDLGRKTGRLREVADEFDRILEKTGDNYVLCLAASSVCEQLSEDLKAAYFEKRETETVSMAEWIVAKDSPYEECCSLRCRAADYLERILAFAKDIPEENRQRMREKVASLKFD